MQAVFVLCSLCTFATISSAEFTSKSAPFTASQIATGSGYNRAQKNSVSVGFWHDAGNKRIKIATTTQGRFYLNDVEGAYHVTTNANGDVEGCEFILDWTYATWVKMHNEKRTKFLGTWTWKDLDGKELDTYLNHDTADASLLLFDTTGATKGALRGAYMAILSTKTTDFTYTLDWYDQVELKEPEAKVFSETDLIPQCKDVKKQAIDKRKAASGGGTTPHKARTQEIGVDAVLPEPLRVDTPKRHNFGSVDDDLLGLDILLPKYSKYRHAVPQQVTGLPPQVNINLKHDLVVEKGAESMMEVTLPKVTTEPEIEKESKYDIVVNHDTTKEVYNVLKNKAGTTTWEMTSIYDKEGMWSYTPNPQATTQPFCMFDSAMKYAALMATWTTLGQAGDFDYAGIVRIGGGPELKLWIGTFMHSEGLRGAMFALVGADNLENTIYMTSAEMNDKATTLWFTERKFTGAVEKAPSSTALTFPDACSNYKKQCNVKDARKCIARILQFSIFEDTKCEVIDKARKCYVDTFCVQHKERVCSSETGKQCALKDCK